ncbi:MAG: hypothetical protein V3W41_03355 [Planctomycetota bacterium]
MKFSLDIFHESRTSRQAHLRYPSDGTEAAVFALFNVHAPPTAPAYATLHVVDPKLEISSQLEDVLSGLRVLTEESMKFEIESFIVSQALDIEADPIDDSGEVPKIPFAIERHRPSGNSTRDLVLDDTEGSKDQRRIVAIFERFIEAEGSMNVLTIVDPRFHTEASVDPLMSMIDSNIGGPTSPGDHQLDVICANFIGQFGAQPTNPQL